MSRAPGVGGPGPDQGGGAGTGGCEAALPGPARSLCCWRAAHSRHPWLSHWYQGQRRPGACCPASVPEGPPRGAVEPLAPRPPHPFQPPPASPKPRRAVVPPQSLPGGHFSPGRQGKQSFRKVGAGGGRPHCSVSVPGAPGRGTEMQGWADAYVPTCPCLGCWLSERVFLPLCARLPSWTPPFLLHAPPGSSWPTSAPWDPPPPRLLYVDPAGPARWAPCPAWAPLLQTQKGLGGAEVPFPRTRGSLSAGRG